MNVIFVKNLIWLCSGSEEMNISAFFSASIQKPFSICALFIKYIAPFCLLLIQ
jgi:hypothetical protein